MAVTALEICRAGIRILSDESTTARHHRAAAFLARYAIETAVMETSHCASMNYWRTRFLYISFQNQTHGRAGYLLWVRLSGIIHYDVFDLVPSRPEIISRLNDAETWLENHAEFKQ